MKHRTLPKPSRVKGLAGSLYKVIKYSKTQQQRQDMVGILRVFCI